MIQELQLRILPEEAASEQSLKQVVARETGTSVPHIITISTTIMTTISTQG